MRPGNRIDRLVEGESSNSDIVDELFLTALSRNPSQADRSLIVHELDDAPDRQKACEDLLWALVNSKEFLFTH